eukprot:gene3860-15157_t
MPSYFCPTTEHNSISEPLNSDINAESTIVNLVTENRASLNTIIAAERFSELNELLRVTAYALRFVNKIRAHIAKTEPIIEELTCEELENARGRIGNAPLSFETRFPLISPREGHVTDLILARCHECMRHIGVKEILTELRSRCGIVRKWEKVRKFLGSCVKCKRIQGKTYNVSTEPDLPDFLTDVGHPFAKIGIDYAGPIFVKNIFGNENTIFKSYIILITFASTRAIHLELAPDMGADALIRALKRFQARSGIPNFIINDNGKTFKDLSFKLYINENGT